MHLVHIGRMTLQDFMQAKDLDDHAVAALVNRDRSSVYRWRKGMSRPDFDALVALEKLSAGQVTASDFVKVAA